MAASTFLSTANIFHSSHLSFSSSSHKHITTVPLIICKSFKEPKSLPISPISLQKRGFCLGFATSLVLIYKNGEGFGANAAILEADDDVELLEKVRKDRQKRIERQGVIKSSTKETAYLQDVIYKLSKVGQAIENNDLATASSVLGKSTETDWIQKANTAFNKLSSKSEEKAVVDTFNSSIAKLISSVVGNDAQLSKIAFVSSASAFEKWTTLTGLVDQLKGL
ncbi:Thylakoid lumenal 16.5 kDa protein, chloroplastic-like protein [Drosera capensis]